MPAPQAGGARAQLLPHRLPDHRIGPRDRKVCSISSDDPGADAAELFVLREMDMQSGPARPDRGRGTRLGPDRGLRHETPRLLGPGAASGRGRGHAGELPGLLRARGARSTSRTARLSRHSPTRSKPRMRARAATPKRSSGWRSPLRPSSSSSSTRFATWSSAPCSTTSARCGCRSRSSTSRGR